MNRPYALRPSFSADRSPESAFFPLSMRDTILAPLDAEAIGFPVPFRPSAAFAAIAATCPSCLQGTQVDRRRRSSSATISARRRPGSSPSNFVAAALIRRGVP